MKWANGRGVLTYRLRQELGPARILVANSGGPLGDSNLNGITLEGVGKRFTVEQARSHFLGQKQVARSPFVAAGWVTQPECALPTLSLMTQIPGMRYGKMLQ